MFLSFAVRQRIINLVKAKHMNLTDLSKIADLSYSTLMNFMTGKGNTITVKTLFSICIGLNMELKDFFDSPLFVDVMDEHEKSSANV